MPGMQRNWQWAPPGTPGARKWSPDDPPARAPIKVGQVPHVRGERVVTVDPDGCHYGFRAYSDLYVRPPEGQLWVDVVTEGDWWRHVLLGARPHIEVWHHGCVWVE